MTLKIKIGVVGARRGQTFITGASKDMGFELVAICDTWQERLDSLSREWKVAAYTNYDKFLEHDMDAVVLANYFHEHAPFAIKAFRAGKHVLSECAACHTLAEGVELAREFEKHNLIYMFAENYPFMVYNQEMRRLYQSGQMGTFKYGECEYVHPFAAKERNCISCGYDHWRNWFPWIYYCTHAMGPIMCITDTRPVKVNGFVVPYDFEDTQMTDTVQRGDLGSIIMCRMDNGAVAKILQASFRGHGNYTRIHGNKGLMENMRCGNKNYVRVWKEPWDKSRDEPSELIYLPDFPDHHDEAMRAGHGGGDFFTLYHFSKAIESGKQPYLDIYRGIDMSIVGILAWRSVLEDSKTFEVPDFRKEQERSKRPVNLLLYLAGVAG